MKSTRTLAMYLPQFHEVPENSQWWGAGYTEWTAVKQAKPCFPGHEQPVIPMNGNYYDLLSKETMVWQAKLAKKYGVDGFCFYHYWFGRGRKILEKPAENLLKWTDIDLPFCFCWDPGTWARTWSKMGNAWADAFEPEKDKAQTRGDGILIQQDFGDASYWEAHFEYLLPFFRDERYLRVDGKPVFIFYNSFLVPCLERMATFWRRLAKKAGFSGLELIGFGIPNRSMDAVIYPMAFGKSSFVYDRSIEHIIPGTSMYGYEYDDVWQHFLANPPSAMQQTLWLGTVSFDDSPRRGANGRIYLHASPAKFRHYFGQLLRKSREAGNSFVFIDAWNEWGEGKKLEPDTKTGYAYLEAVRDMTQTATEDLPVIDAVSLEEGREQYVENLEWLVLRNQKLYILFRDWRKCMREHRDLATYFRDRKWHRIGLYGYGRHGRDFYQDVQGHGVEIVYLIDARKEGMSGKTPVPVYAPDEELPDCDAVVVSVVDEYEAILEMLQERMDVPIVSLSEVVSAVAEE